MNEFEKQLQEEVEKGIAPTNSDALAYRVVFSALRKDRGPALTPFFADKVIQRALLKNPKKRYVTDYLWLAAGCFALIICMLITLSFTSIPTISELISPLREYVGLLATVGLMIAAFSILDRKIVPKPPVAT